MQILSRTPNDFFSNTEVWHVRSQHVGDVFRVCVSAPDGPLPDGLRVGALYATDAGISAGAVTSAARTLVLGGEAPPMFAVNIGYAHDASPGHLVRRNRDLTPTARTDFDPVMPMLLGDAAGMVPSGGADAFLAFVLDELRPALEDAYPLDAQQATLAGISFGGLFAVHALQARPGAFARILAISPALWWDNGVLLERARRQVAAGPAPAARLWMCAGELESAEHIRQRFLAYPPELLAKLPADMRGADMIGHMQAMAQTLAPWQGERFRVECQVLAGESHTSIFGAGLSHGLRALCRP